MQMSRGRGRRRRRRRKNKPKKENLTCLLPMYNVTHTIEPTE